MGEHLRDGLAALIDEEEERVVPVFCSSFLSTPSPELSAYFDLRRAIEKTAAAFPREEAVVLIRYLAACVERGKEPRL